jgi:hypothetical protein
MRFAHRPYEFGVKVSVATTLAHAKAGQFVTHAKALPSNPYDRHTLKTVIPDMEVLVGIFFAIALTSVPASRVRGPRISTSSVDAIAATNYRALTSHQWHSAHRYFELLRGRKETRTKSPR